MPTENSGNKKMLVTTVHKSDYLNVENINDDILMLRNKIEKIDEKLTLRINFTNNSFSRFVHQISIFVKCIA